VLNPRRDLVLVEAPEDWTQRKLNDQFSKRESEVTNFSRCAATLRAEVPNSARLHNSNCTDSHRVAILGKNSIDFVGFFRKAVSRISILQAIVLPLESEPWQSISIALGKQKARQ
jgi:hypothetical protein